MQRVQKLHSKVITKQQKRKQKIKKDLEKHSKEIIEIQKRLEDVISRLENEQNTSPEHLKEAYQEKELKPLFEKFQEINKKVKSTALQQVFHNVYFSLDENGEIYN